VENNFGNAKVRPGGWPSLVDGLATIHPGERVTHVKLSFTFSLLAY